eukprot:TRINITY_DN651_c0_g1_i5.p1 TRINITY_DN651_c0_g1~~TRINITY_DN651_c0_g1_i5.p1  ORF type:complete len:137 (+),score=54.37 TRINITY_DN651_c0_g1_i5:45-455(+)
MIFVFFFFFFQAEDGIRDAQESRGLGDVYKRQVSTQSTGADSLYAMDIHPTPEASKAIVDAAELAVSLAHQSVEPVHLACILFTPGEYGASVWEHLRPISNTHIHSTFQKIMMALPATVECADERASAVHLSLIHI